MARSKNNPRQASVATSRASSIHKLLPLLVVLAGLAAYYNSFSGVFVLDDRRTIIKNDRLRHLDDPGAILSRSRRPVVELTFALNYAAGDLDVRGYHAVNLAVHILAGLTLLGVIRRTLLLEPYRQRFGRASPWLALAISVVWVVHPLQTQAVTYIIQRSESMMGLFYLLTLYCVIRGAGSARAARWHVAAILACALGMGSKAIMVTAPLVVLLYDRTFLGGSFGSALRRRWQLYLGLGATWAVLAGVGIVRGVLFPAEGAKTTVGFGFAGITPAEYAWTQPGVILHYLRLSLWPEPLCLDYAWPVARGWVQVFLPGLVVLLLVGGSVAAFRWKPWLGFAGLWFFAILAPTSSFIPIRDPLFEHRMYLPLAAVVTVVVMAGRGLLVYGFRRWGWAGRLRLLTSASLVTTIVVACVYGSVRRNRAYESEMAMWADVVAKRPNNARACCNLGFEFARQGRTQEALPYYKEAVLLEPNSYTNHYNLANTTALLGHPALAIEHYAEAVRLKPDYAEALVNWAMALSRTDQLDQAITCFQAALAVRSVLARPELELKARVSLGNALFGRGDLGQAVEQYALALRIKPDHYRAHYNLGLALQRQNRLQEALEEYRETLRLKPDHAAARQAASAIEAVISKTSNQPPRKG